MAASFTRKFRGGLEYIDARAATFTLTYLEGADVYRLVVDGVQIFDAQPRQIEIRASSLGSDVVEVGTAERDKPQSFWVLTYTNGNDSSGTRAEYLARLRGWGAREVQSTSFTTAGGSSNAIEICTVPVGASGRLVIDMDLSGVRTQTVVLHINNEGADWTDPAEFPRLAVNYVTGAHRGDPIVNHVRVYGEGTGNAVVIGVKPETGFAFDCSVVWYLDTRTAANRTDSVTLLSGTAFATNPPSNPTFSEQRAIFLGTATSEPGRRRVTRLHRGAASTTPVHWQISTAGSFTDYDDLGCFDALADTVLTAQSDAIWVVTVFGVVTNDSAGAVTTHLELVRVASGERLASQSMPTNSAGLADATLSISAVVAVAAGDQLQVRFNAADHSLNATADTNVRILELTY